MVLLSSSFAISRHLPCSTFKSDIWNICRVNSWNISSSKANKKNFCVKMCSVSSTYGKSKRVWIWTENKQVMTAAVERGWNTFVFSSQNQELAKDWSTIALIDPLFLKEGEVFDGGNRRVGNVFEVSTPQELQNLQPADDQAENVVIDLLDWQVIPAENIVAAFQGSEKTVFAISKTPSEAQIFLEALEQGLGGVVLKAEDDKAVLELKEYFDRRNEVNNLLSLTKATVTRVDIAGMGDRVCVDLCSLMRPGEGLLDAVVDSHSKNTVL